jgi:hypothetical protein
VPRIKEHNGRSKWVVNGDIPLAGNSAVSAILPDGEKMLGIRFLQADIDRVHAASYEGDARLEIMDSFGISHGIVYPNVGGFGNQNFLRIDDRDLPQAASTTTGPDPQQCAQRDTQPLKVRSPFCLTNFKALP